VIETRVVELDDRCRRFRRMSDTGDNRERRCQRERHGRECNCSFAHRFLLVSARCGHARPVSLADAAAIAAALWTSTQA